MKKLFIILFFASIKCVAQQDKGDLSIQFSGNFLTQKVTYAGTEIKTTSGNIYVKFGQFFTPNIELGVKPNVFFFMEPDEKDTKKQKLKTNVGFGLYGTYSFLTADGKLVPYAGGEINYIPIGDESTVNLGPYAGVKYFVKENVSIDVNGNYSFNVGSSFGDGDLRIGGLFMLNVGIGVLLPKLD